MACGMGEEGGGFFDYFILDCFFVVFFYGFIIFFEF